MKYEEPDSRENSAESEEVEYRPSNGSEKFVKVALIMGGIMLALMVIVIIALSITFKQPGNSDSEQGTDVAAETSEGAAASGGGIVTLEDGSKNFNGLVVSPIKTQKNGDSIALTGTVVNKKPRALRFVQVEINLYDANGTYLNTTLDNVDSLEDGALWRFSAPVNDEDFATCEVANVTSW